MKSHVNCTWIISHMKYWCIIYPYYLLLVVLIIIDIFVHKVKHFVIILTIRALNRKLIGCMWIQIYSCSAWQVSFQIIFKFINFKKTYTPINILVMPQYIQYQMNIGYFVIFNCKKSKKVLLPVATAVHSSNLVL